VPRSLFALILGVTIIPLAVLAWLGYRLVQQDRVIEDRQLQQRAEQAADTVVAAFQRVTFASQQRLASGIDTWPEGSVAVTITGAHSEAYPQGRIAYLPSIVPLHQASTAILTRIDEIEFRQHNSAISIQYFHELANSDDLAVRAAGLLSLGRTLEALGQTNQALAVYGQLATMDSVALADTPASLVGAYARCKLLEGQRRFAELKNEGQRFENDLHSGRWNLTAPLYWLYSRDAAKWAGAELEGSPNQSEVFAEAAGTLWQNRNSLPPSGQELLTIAGQAIVVLWDSRDGTLRALIASPTFIRSQWIPAIMAVVNEPGISWRLETGNGKVDFGDLGSGKVNAMRSARETGLPWSVVALVTSPLPEEAQFLARRRLLILGLAVLALMGLTSSYLIVRSVGRELAAARLQSDFVAAVSHEFRTPLTALRQYTDMLLERSALGNDRRQLCYQAQSRATDRLTRLVESLLDFGRIEARARQYIFEPRDCTELVHQVVNDFRPEAESVGYEIQFAADCSVLVAVDVEAFSRALWNLLENAIKYSPDCHTVEVQVTRCDDTVQIAVRDHGIGVPVHEQSAIFTKFHRGEQARNRGIRGTGIGLAMANHIVKAHRGTIHVQSEPGIGSTFTIVIPAKASI
jgi:signal transduction histidine kinase